MLNKILCLVILISVSNNCYAYLDPGSGGMLLQLLLGGVAGFLAVLKFYWSSIKSRIKNFLSKNK